jgi:hypothetical protein
MADLAIVSHAQSAPVSTVALAARRAAGFQAERAAGVRGFKDTAARQAHSMELAEVRASAAHQAHVAHITRLAKRAAAARAAQAAAAARQAAQPNAARPPSSGSSSSATAPATQSAPSGSAQQIAQQMLDTAGQGGQFTCLDSLWSHESGWNVYASNPGTGAYGIPQALPGGKMASAGADWQTDAATQIRWGLSYIDTLYGSPCGAWVHEEAHGWY